MTLNSNTIQAGTGISNKPFVKPVMPLINSDSKLNIVIKGNRVFIDGSVNKPGNFVNVSASFDNLDDAMGYLKDNLS